MGKDISATVKRQRSGAWVRGGSAVAERAQAPEGEDQESDEQVDYQQHKEGQPGRI